MARTNFTPHRPSNPHDESFRNIPHAPIATDWISAQLKAHKPKRQRDLEEAFRILGAGIYDPGSVTTIQLAWAKEYARKEQEFEDAEHETLSANSEGDFFEDQEEDSGNDNEENEDADFLASFISPRQNPIIAPLTTANLASLDFQDKDANIVTSSLSTVSNVSALKPEDNPAEPSETPSSAMSNQNSITANTTAPISSLEARLQHAIDTLQYDEDPADRPYWLTGLSKPLPHPDLTDLEDLEVENRFWNDEISRLTKMRRELPLNPLAMSTSAADRKSAGKKAANVKGKGKTKDNRSGGDNGGNETRGDWHFNHFTRTEPVIKIQRKRRTTVFARGIWEFKTTPNDEVVCRILDEWPLTEEGEMLGWGAVSGEQNQVVDVEMAGDGREGGFGVWEVQEGSVLGEDEEEDDGAENGDEEEVIAEGNDEDEDMVGNGGDDNMWEDVE